MYYVHTYEENKALFSTSPILIDPRQTENTNCMCGGYGDGGKRLFVIVIVLFCKVEYTIFGMARVSKAINGTRLGLGNICLRIICIHTFFFLLLVWVVLRRSVQKQKSARYTEKN